MMFSQREVVCNTIALTPCGNAVIAAHVENLMDSTETRLNISGFLPVLPTGLPQSLGKV